MAGDARGLREFRSFISRLRSVWSTGSHIPHLTGITQRNKLCRRLYNRREQQCYIYKILTDELVFFNPVPCSLFHVPRLAFVWAVVSPTIYMTTALRHYCDVIMGAMASQITSLTIVYSTFIQAQIKENIKAPRHSPLGGEFTGDRWIPCTNG